MVLEDKKACLFLTGRKDKDTRSTHTNTSTPSMASMATVAMAANRFAKGHSVTLYSLNTDSNLTHVYCNHPSFAPVTPTRRKHHAPLPLPLRVHRPHAAPGDERAGHGHRDHADIADPRARWRHLRRHGRAAHAQTRREVAACRGMTLY